MAKKGKAPDYQALIQRLQEDVHQAGTVRRQVTLHAAVEHIFRALYCEPQGITLSEGLNRVMWQALRTQGS